jgi:hypothetical protein
MSLDDDLAFFEANRAGLLASDRGHFALVREQALLGIYRTAEEACDAGGKGPFLVLEITDHSPSPQIVDSARYSVDGPDLDVPQAAADTAPASDVVVSPPTWDAVDFLSPLFKWLSELHLPDFDLPDLPDGDGG